MKTKILKFIKIFFYSLAGLIAAAVIIIIGLSLTEHPANPPYVYGVTFRYPYAQALGLNWKSVYISMFNDLHIKNIRIPVYWDEIEKQKGRLDFSNLDFEVGQAQANHAQIILAVGRRVPGWPECHIPSWVQNENWDQRQADLMSEITTVVNRYKDNSSLQYWQVENEPFLVKFGLCPQYDVAGYLDQEIALIKKLDPKHRIIVTDSGELSIWIRAADRADIFGSTVYRKVYSSTFHGYINYHWPSIIFRAKEGFVHLFNPGKEIINIELQGEPWTTKGIPNTSFAEQAKTFPKGALTANLNFAHQAGFSTTYFWGVEYWYWAASHGHPEFLQEAKQIFSQ